VLVVVVKGVEEDTKTDPLVAGAKHRAFQPLRLFKKFVFLCENKKINNFSSPMIYYLPYLIDKIFFYNCHRKICGFVNSLASRILVPNSGLQISKYGSVRNIFSSGHSMVHLH
jgi:hypothetical protein